MAHFWGRILVLVVNWHNSQVTIDPLSSSSIEGVRVTSEVYCLAMSVSPMPCVDLPSFSFFGYVVARFYAAGIVFEFPHSPSFCFRPRQFLRFLVFGAAYTMSCSYRCFFVSIEFRPNWSSAGRFRGIWGDMLRWVCSLCRMGGEGVVAGASGLNAVLMGGVAIWMGRLACASMLGLGVPLGARLYSVDCAPRCSWLYS